MAGRTGLGLTALGFASAVFACGSDPGETVGTANGGSHSAGTGGGDSAGAGAGGQSGTGGASTGECAACLTQEILEGLYAHAHDLSLTASLLAGHPSADEMVGFFLVPGLTGENGVPGSFLTPVETCSEPTMFDPFCEENRCSRLSCTGEGASWNVSYWLEEPTIISGFEFESALVDSTWADGALGIGFTLETVVTGPGGVVWSATGSGTMDPEALDGTEVFPELCPLGPATLVIHASPDDESGSLAVGNVVIAEISNGELVPTGSCP